MRELTDAQWVGLIGWPAAGFLAGVQDGNGLLGAGVMLAMVLGFIWLGSKL